MGFDELTSLVRLRTAEVDISMGVLETESLSSDVGTVGLEITAWEVCVTSPVVELGGAGVA